VVARLPRWLHERYGVELKFGACVNSVESGRVSANNLHWEGDRVIIANGVDFRSLFPARFAAAGFQRCKLQMMRTGSQPDGWRIGPMLASGLTLRHYPTFAICPSLTALKKRIATETPELEQFGIHVMASQNGRGEVVLGDSHEYFKDVTPFDKSAIEQRILAQLRQLIDLPSWDIQERWHGVYAKAPGLVEYDAEIEPEVFAAISSGGAGMTLSMGLAESHWELWDSSSGSAADAASRHAVAIQE
jgi:FAD dependent oxidoreductase TIGR03364